MKTEISIEEAQRLRQADRLYLFLAAIFIASLVASNLIFQKFFGFRPLGFLESWGLDHPWIQYHVEVSVGLLPYPITFLVTDAISELYGKAKADRVVFGGIFASLFVLGLISLSDAVTATPWSPVDDDTFHMVFGLTGAAVLASMLAYLSAQFVDIRIYHFWKRITKGRRLWLRNNFSTIPSQAIDTALVLSLLIWAGAIEPERFGLLFLHGFLFKVIIALIDTPFLYLIVGASRRHFRLGLQDELR